MPPASAPGSENNLLALAFFFTCPVDHQPVGCLPVSALVFRKSARLRTKARCQRQKLDQPDATDRRMFPAPVLAQTKPLSPFRQGGRPQEIHLTFMLVRLP